MKTLEDENPGKCGAAVYQGNVLGIQYMYCTSIVPGTQ